MDKTILDNKQRADGSASTLGYKIVRKLALETLSSKETLKQAIQQNKADKQREANPSLIHNWFLYWKISPSLWESKIRAFPKNTPLLIPIHWALHGQRDDKAVHYDFGNYRPDCDLKKIETLALNCGMDPIFFVPLTPMPFLTNGGLPEWLVAIQSCSKTGMDHNILTAEGKIRKLASFYHPQVFKHYKNFLASLGQTFVQKGFQSKIKGCQWGYFDEDEFVSIIDDYSDLFQSSYGRFLERNPLFKDKPNAEVTFQTMLSKLLEQVAEDCLHSYWDGAVKIDLWGTHERDFVMRSLMGDLYWNEFIWASLFKSLTNGILPSSLLFETGNIPETLDRALKDLVGYSFFKKILNEENISGRNTSFLPYIASEVITKNDDLFRSVGLKGFLEEKCSQNFRLVREKVVNLEEEDDGQRVYIYFARDLEKGEIKSVLKLLMAGKKIILDTYKMSDEQRKVFDLFIMENGIKGQLVQKVGLVGFFPFGDGKLVTIESNAFETLSMKNKTNFWEKIFQFMRASFISVNADKGVQYYFLSRESNSFELNYDEVRRVHFYNPTSETKSIFVPNSRSFAFLRYVNSHNAHVKSSPSGVSLKLDKFGSIALDYGYISNR